MEEVSSKKHHVDVLLFCQTHNFVEALPAVIATDGVSLVIADMAVRRNEYTDRVGSCDNVSFVTRAVFL